MLWRFVSDALLIVWRCGGIAPTSSEALGRLFARLPALEEVSLGGNNRLFSEEGLTGLAAGLREAGQTELKRLHLDNCNISPEAEEALSRLFGGLPQRRSSHLNASPVSQLGRSNASRSKTSFMDSNF